MSSVAVRRDALVAVLDASGMSERKLARKAGVSRSTVNHMITRRRTRCRATTAALIAKALGVQPSALFSEVGVVHHDDH